VRRFVAAFVFPFGVWRFFAAFVFRFQKHERRKGAALQTTAGRP
jgi:hypothetical protein